MVNATSYDVAACSNVENSDLGEIFDAGLHPRAKLGFVLLATEQTIEENMFRLCPRGVGVHFTRAYNPDSITVESLSRQADDLARAASTLLPDGSLDVIGYACTSGSLVIGEDRVFAELSKGAPGAQTTSLISGVLRALRALDARRVAVATPYLDEINAREVTYMQRAGFEICAIRGLNLEKDSDMIRVRPEAIARLAVSVDRPDADAVFISCGALRSLDVVDALEQELGKPVICSNQAMMWDMLRLAGIEDRIEGYGRLFRDH
ncbi:arylmalonate decarboxylase [Defluviimonas sp. WL0075]|uniref:Arylmalonate decarboxylase n=1 Tax=Albidovulum sediminicola TaxID=2984331 RepID=A0ABT2Z6G3_9RHOB|nr:arylmalonate decarboxylase [Defluviimonas sp. WL0075]MCV2866723.1 arylmalonate decarboxylase [Defluviimonas sp. WL0075]